MYLPMIRPQHPSPLEGIAACMVALVVLGIVAVGVALLLAFALIATPGYLIIKLVRIPVRAGFIIGELIQHAASYGEDES